MRILVRSSLIVEEFEAYFLVCFECHEEIRSFFAKIYQNVRLIA